MALRTIRLFIKKEIVKAKNGKYAEWFEVKNGNYTIARFDQENGNYKLLGGKFRSTDGPYTFGTYIWAEFENLPGWEHKLIEGPYIHHLAEIEEDYSEVLAEFCKYIPGLEYDTVTE